MHTEVPSVRDYEYLEQRVNALAKRVDEHQSELAAKCEHDEVIALIEAAAKQGRVWGRR
jgi:hypothetical protein